MPDTYYRPGAYDAVMEGCRCTQCDGEPQDNEDWPDWLVRGCPLHDSEFNTRFPNLNPESSFL